MVRRAGIWRRGLAAGIDALVFLALGFLLSETVEEPLRVRMARPEMVENLISLIMIVLWLAYSTMEIFVGGTAGKILMGIVIARVDGEKAPRPVLVFRWFTKQMPWILFLFYGMSFNGGVYYLAGLINGIIWIGCLQMMDENKRSWLDQWAHTSVVVEKSQRV